jgi:hypothetical protein
MSPTHDKANRIGRPAPTTKQVYSGDSAQHKESDVDTTPQLPMRCSSRQIRNGLILANVIGWMAIVIAAWRLLF